MNGKSEVSIKRKEVIECLSIDLPISDTETAEFCCFDTDDTSKKKMEEISSKWDILWPQIQRAFEEGVKGYETNQKIGGKGFGGFFLFNAYGGSDLGCDFGVGFQMPDDVPGWDFEITDWKVSGYQAVY